MPLSKERIGEIAMNVLQGEMERKGLPLDRKEIRRSMHNEAKNFGCTTGEFAQFARIIYARAYESFMRELDKVIADNADDKVEGS
jgi:hypothetical protein